MPWLLRTGSLVPLIPAILVPFYNGANSCWTANKRASSRWPRAWLPIMGRACTSRCITSSHSRPGAMPTCCGRSAITFCRQCRKRDYEELKQELGLGHYEGRNWRGFHHHGVLCIAAYGFLMAERSRFSPSAHVGHLGLRAAAIPPHFRPRGAKGSCPTA